MTGKAVSERGLALDEVKRLHDLIERRLRETHVLPEGVRAFDVEFGEDSTGEPALWVWFQVEEGFPTTKDAISQLDQLARSAKSVIFESGIDRQPYVRFRSAA